MLILLRHGQTPSNAAALIQGESDTPLDDTGVAQAVRAGEYIRLRYDIDTVITSPKRRTIDTAVHAGFDLAMHEVDPRWSEINFGEFEQRSVAEASMELGRRWEADIDYQPEGGESLAALHRRVAAASTELMERSVDENILVVTHATPIKSAVIWATGGGPEMILNLWAHTGAVTVLNRMHGSVVLTEFNRQILLDG